MMNEREALMRLIHGATFWDEDGPEYATHALNSDAEGRLADALTEAGYRREPEPREVTTVEELDALPEGVVILSEVGGVWERWLDGIGAVWRETGSSAKHYSSDIALPAVILFTPGAERGES